MKNWTVRQRIICGLSAIILVMVGLGIFAYIRLVTINAQATLLATDSLPGLYAMGAIKSAATENYALIQEHVLSHDQEEKRQFESKIQSSTTRIDDLIKQYTPTVTTDEDRQLLSALTTARTLPDSL
jgi:methyl-accepting chemotaxis protein WspA